MGLRPIHLGLLLSLLATLPAMAQTTSTAPATQAAPEVPARFIDGIAQWVVLPEEEPPDTEKIRRFNKAMRLATDAEREYPNAPNLHVVRNLMLTAAQNLAALDNSDENRARVLDIAQRIVESDAPDEAKLPADMLLTQIRIINGSDKEIAGQINRFVARYKRAAPAAALIRATMLAKENGQDRMAEQLAQTLSREYLDEPNVRAFLRVRFGWNSDVGRSFKAQLTRLDGAKLTLPRDAFGKTLVLQYYTDKSPACIPAMAEARGFYVQHKDEVEIVSICLDRSREEAERFVQQQKMDWPVIFSGLGKNDPTATAWGIQQVPYYWMVASDGRSVGNDFYLWNRAGDWRPWTLDHINRGRLLNQQVAFFATGVYLVSVPPTKPLPPAPATSQPIAVPPVSPDPAAKTVPQALVDAMEALLVFPLDNLADAYKMPRYEAMIELGGAIEKAYPAAADLYLIRNRILSATMGVALIKRDAPSWQAAARLAEAALQSSMPEEAKLLARSVLLQKKIMTGEITDADAAAAVREMVAAYASASGNADPNALLAGVIMSLELGDNPLRAELLAALGKYNDAPFVRQMLRRIFNGHPDQGKPFNAVLTRADGTQLKLPDDLRGKVVIVTFWRKPVARDPEKRDGTGLPTLDAFQKRPGFSTSDVAIVCISLDGSAPDTAALSKAFGTEQIHCFTGLGRYDPTAQKYGISTTPSLWVLDRNGIVHSDEHQGNDVLWPMQQKLAERRSATQNK